MNKRNYQHLVVLAMLVLPVLLFALAPPIPIAPLPGTKSRNTKQELIVDCPAEAEMLNFQLFNAESAIDEPIAEIYTPYYSWLVPEDNIIPGPLPAELQPGEYLWTCRARYDDVWSDFFRPYWNFEVTRDQPPDGDGVVKQLPEPPTPVAPTPGTKMQEPNVILEVRAPAEFELFHFRVKYQPNGMMVCETYTEEPTWNVPFMMPVEPGTYEWSCRGYNSGVWSYWFTPWWTFEIGQSAKGTMGEPSGLEHIRLSAEPNPCGPVGTKLCFNLSRTARVSAAVYNPAGKLVRSLATSELLGPGICHMAWNGTDEAGKQVGTGTYLCRILTDDSGHVVKIIKSR